MNRNKVSKLPRNLALENIVFRYQEIQSKNLARNRHSLDLTLDLPCLGSPGVGEPSCVSPGPASGDSDGWSMEEGTEICGLCEDVARAKASWYCDQCCVAYCQRCLDTFHPRRGPLAHHRLRRPVRKEGAEKEAFCSDHEAEVAAIFCDQCQQLVCHLCVCDGVGKHSQHKILSLDTAFTQTKVKLDIIKWAISN